MSAKLELVEASATRLGDGTYLIRLVVENGGYLSTAGSEMARQNGVSREVVAEIDLPENANLLRGKRWQEIGHLPGRVGMTASPVFMGTGFDAMDGKSSRATMEWLVEAAPGTTVHVTARQERSGRLGQSITCT
jgi:hypothetical protein